MRYSAPQRAVMFGLRDLEVAYGEGRRSDLATVQLAAQRYPRGEKVTPATLNGLSVACKVFRDGGFYQLTESGRVNLREGL